MVEVPVEATADVRGAVTTYYIDHKEIMGTVPLDLLGSYSRGDIIIGGATEWTDLAVGAANSILTNDGTDVDWSDHLITGVSGKTLAFNDSITLTSTADPLTLNFPITAAQTTVITTTSDADGTPSTVIAGDASGLVALGGLGIGTATAASDTIVLPDGGTVGQAAGPLLTFDDTANDLIVTGTSTLQVLSAESTEPIILIENTNENTVSVGLDFYKNSASPADDDDIGTIRFYAINSAAKTLYASVVAETLDVTGGSAAGGIRTAIMMDGTSRNILDIKGFNGTLDQGEFIINEMYELSEDVLKVFDHSLDRTTFYRTDGFLEGMIRGTGRYIDGRELFVRPGGPSHYDENGHLWIAAGFITVTAANDLVGSAATREIRIAYEFPTPGRGIPGRMRARSNRSPRRRPRHVRCLGRESPPVADW